MAGWISSKLKVAETLLHQIDQQAAESLKKGERRSLDKDLNLGGTIAKTSGADTVGGVASASVGISLKDQLKSKSIDKNDSPIGKLDIDRIRIDNATGKSSAPRDRDNKDTPKSEAKPRPTLTDSDWTELLSTPTKKSHSTNSKSASPTTGLGIRGLKKQGGKGVLGSPNLNAKNGNTRPTAGSVKKAGNGPPAEKLNGRLGDGRINSDGEELRTPSFTPRVSNVGSDDKVVEGWELGDTSFVLDSVKEVGQQRNSDSDAIGRGNGVNVKTGFAEADSDKSKGEVLQVNTDKNLNLVSEVSNGKKSADKHNRTRTDAGGRVEKSSTVSTVNYSSSDLKSSHYRESDDDSDSDSESGSSSDSELEREREERRKRRQQILAAKAAAKAAEAIKERENLVARLEGEKQSLEKILDERAKQAAQEASELQSSMMETMEAVDVEKQKHNNTMMEALPRLAKLETENAGLAKSLATAQWNLEVELNRVAELWEQIESKEAAHEELRRRILSTHQTETSLSNLVASKGIQLEKEMLEAEDSFLTDKIQRLQEKAEKLEEDIELTQRELENPTEVEVELKRRLRQMTDHLIQKQAQVESLSSEKATLLFRIEAVSKLDENKSLLNLMHSSGNDLELGACDDSKSKIQPMFVDRIRSGKQHLGYFVRQLDAVFAAGSVFLRMNPTAKIWAVVYITCLHLWVLYIFCSHASSSGEPRSGAVVSLENLNNTSI